jgi:tetratricopeptide (TPR) repeat protein
MKQYNKTITFLTCGLMLAACSDIDEQEPQSGSLTQDQLQETNTELPERIEATFSGMFTMMAKPSGTYPSSSRADDFWVIMAALSQDAEGADLEMPDNNYNWFSVANELSSRNANYANPYIRYVNPYRQIGVANEVIASYPEDTDSEDAINKIAQARAIRAFDYMALAPYFQFGYSTAKDEPCVPIIKDGVDATNNPRATVAEVYEYVIEDLNYAVEHLAGYDRKGDKSKISQNVAYGLRARAYLAIGEYAKAAEDAAKAMEGFTPASREDVSVPAFYSASEGNWMWAYLMTETTAQINPYATADSWLSAFSGDGYAAACQCTPQINVLLYKQIPDTDVRKGWWLDENLHTDHWTNLSWSGATGDEIASLVLDDGSKVAFLPYTNVKFGVKSGIGSTTNNSDWPLMRVEEMILIQAEGLAKSGNESQARQVLDNFVRTYRDPSYSSTSSSRTLADEIWFQRRVELWGEGFFTSDAKRLGKNIVRFHNANESSNLSTSHIFNIEATDGWLNMRFPQTEMDNNLGIVDNTGGSQPVAGQNPSLRDGVTD